MSKFHTTPLSRKIWLGLLCAIILKGSISIGVFITQNWDIIKW